MSTTVKRITKFGYGFQYHTLCDGCDNDESIVISRETHDSSTDYLKQIAKDRGARDMIVNPVSADEDMLLDFAAELEDDAKLHAWIS